MITRLLKELFGHLYGVRDDYNPHGVQVEAGKVEHFSGKRICDFFRQNVFNTISTFDNHVVLPDLCYEKLTLRMSVDLG